jgi:hypothetical protein
MTKKFDKLNETFNVDNDIVSINVESETVTEKIEKVALVIDDVKKDYDYTRGNLYSLIEKGQEAINGILELAQESEMPRAYEVAGQLIKSVGDITDKLLDLQKKVKDIEEDNPKGPTTDNNALFVGSTAELAKLLKQQQLDNENV